MTRLCLVLLVVLGSAAAAAAATWTCTLRTQGILGGGDAYVAVAGCAGSGPYTTGGDPVGDGSAAQAGTALCGSAARVPETVLTTLGYRAAGTAFAIVYDRDARKFLAYTAAAEPGPAVPAVEVAAGTVLNVWIAIIAFCR